MRGWKITEIAGIGVYIHWTFLLLPFLVASSALSSGSGMAVAVEAVLFVLAIFVCVVLHELGHALMARRFGIGTRSITLLPIGGVASLDRMPERPSQELAVALAGPAVNVAIAAVLFVVLGTIDTIGAVFTPAAIMGSFLIRLFWANLALVIFNMLPAFPMDGGRVLRSLLAMFTSFGRATNVAAAVGQMMAVLFALVGIYSQHWMLVFVAAFVFLAGRAEAASVRARSALEGWHVGDAMRRQFQMVPASISLDEAARTALFVSQDDFPVIKDNRLVGMLSKPYALQMLSQGQGHLRVEEVMQKDIPMLEQDAPLSETVSQMQLGNYTSLPVAHAGRLVGILTLAGLRDWMLRWTSQPVTAERV
ncbi:MAG: site-2 protease family protein [Pirellulaceae bacterium]